ncbi:MAG TPA: sulfurtransferase [Burkholderiaceae bacterium]|jgi:thiosulfate/3-mercaptopyruvate sulfurtransferase|nr:sulfurtransferase [Burkholderiaceae bacterium]
MSNAESPNILLRVEQLRTHLQDARWCVVDVRHDLFDAGAGIRAYREGHIPGAVFANIDTQLSGIKTGLNGRHPLPSRDDLIETFREWGINNDTQIVAYDAQGGQFASRLWWLARWLGHRRVALLDGGWSKWSSETQLISRDMPVRARGNFTPSESMMPLVTVQQLLQRLEESDRTLLDARTPERYRGEEEPIDPVAGRIPGARNRPWQQNLNSDQTFKSPSVLRSEFDALLAARSPSQVTHQCGSGVTACHNVFAMELAGLPGSALYAGSWSEWIADPKRPIATG